MNDVTAVYTYVYTCIMCNFTGIYMCTCAWLYYYVCTCTCTFIHRHVKDVLVLPPYFPSVSVPAYTMYNVVYTLMA